MMSKDSKIGVGHTINVLDKGYVKFVDSMGTDLSPIESARMSTDNPTGMDEVKDDKLREFLWKNNHTSPFESLILTVEMKLPIVVLRELDRHRSIDIDNTVIDTQSDFRKYNSRNEFSGRYAEMPNEYYIPNMDRVQAQSTTNKQGSSNGLSESVQSHFIAYSEGIADESYRSYTQFLEKGLAREVARFNLPLSQYTKVRVSANFVNWAKTLKLRLAEDAQWEIRQYAHAIADIIKELWPKTYQVFEKYSIDTVVFTKDEAKVLHIFMADILIRNVDDIERIKGFVKDKLGDAGSKLFFKKIGYQL
jgi:thymidylate synthase (FAD)